MKRFITKTLFSAGLLLILSATTFCTTQIPDKLIFQGREFVLQSFPLEQIFNDNPTIRPKGDLILSSLWRGYVATFELSKSEIVVRDIQVIDRAAANNSGPNFRWRSVIETVKLAVNVEALRSFSGILIAASNENSKTEYQEKKAAPKIFVLLEMQNGVLAKSRILPEKGFIEFKATKFAEFKKTLRFREVAKELKTKEGFNDAEIDACLLESISDNLTTIN